MEIKYLRTVRLISILSIGFLASCAAIDHSKLSRMGHLVDEGFELLQNSFVYESKVCGDINQSFFSGFEDCNVIQVAGGCLPETNDMYKSDPNDAASKMKKCMRDRGSGWMKRANKIIGYVPKGTMIKITKIVEHPFGSIGRLWIIRANIVTREMKGLEISLSGPYAFSPSWFKPLDAPSTIPQINLEILKPVI